MLGASVHITLLGRLTLKAEGIYEGLGQGSRALHSRYACCQTNAMRGLQYPLETTSIQDKFEEQPAYNSQNFLAGVQATKGDMAGHRPSS